MLKVVRIDYRLLHGQVVFAWTRNMGVDFIVVADDNAAQDKFLKMSLGLAKPAGVGLEIGTTKDTIKRINAGRYQRKKVMLVCGNTKELLELVKGVDDIKLVNYGNIGKKEDSKAYTSSIFLTPDEIEDTKQILDNGVTIQMQQLPTTEIVELNHNNL